MALVKFGQGVAQMSGKLGGTVFARNKGGATARNFQAPINPSTPQQSVVRNIMTSLSDDWVNLLTQTQRDGWEAYSFNVQGVNRLGDPITLPALSWFTGSNVARIQAGLVQANDAPTIFTRGEGDSLLAVTASEATQLLSVTFDILNGWVDEDDAGMVIYTSRPQNETVKFFKGPYRLAGVIEGDSVTAPTSPDATLTSAFAFVAGQRVFGYARIIRADGRYSSRMPFQLDGLA